MKCFHCSHEIEWMWVVKYTSDDLTWYINLCSNCDAVLKIQTGKQSNNLIPKENYCQTN